MFSGLAHDDRPDAAESRFPHRDITCEPERSPLPPRKKLCEILRALRLAEPEPKILGAGSLAHLPLETTLLTQVLGIGVREGHTHSGIRGASMAVPNNAVHLKFKEGTRPENAAYFPAIRGDHLGARDMLEDDEGKSEIVGLVGHSG